jgi:hypothetical protein
MTWAGSRIGTAGDVEAHPMPFTYMFDAATNVVRTTAHGLIRVDPDFAVFRDLGEAEAWLRQGAR